MDVIDQIAYLLAKKTFSSESVKQKTKEALLKTLKPLADIKASHEPQDTCGYDDGVPEITIHEFDERQRSERQSLRVRNKGFFDSDDSDTLTENGINARGKWGYSLLHHAALEGNEKECKRLLKLGADKSLCDNGGKMPYHKALLKGYTELAEKLKP